MHHNRLMQGSANFLSRAREKYFRLAVQGIPGCNYSAILLCFALQPEVATDIDKWVLLIDLIHRTDVAHP